MANIRNLLVVAAMPFIAACNSVGAPTIDTVVEKTRIQEIQSTRKRTISEQKKQLNVYWRKDAYCGDLIVDAYESCEIDQPNCTNSCELTTGAYWRSSK